MVNTETPNFNDQASKPNLEQLMRLGIETARAGHKTNARVIFRQVLDEDPDNERALLWLAAVADDSIERLRYLNTVLNVNPNNETALEQIEKMKQRKETSNTKVIRYGFFGLTLIMILVIIVILILIAL